MECELDTGLKGYDWGYIETNASQRLKQEMMNRGVLISAFPTATGVSKLKTMLRLDVTAVGNAFRQKRRDIRWAIHNGIRRDLSSNDLPDIPLAPSSIAGSRVLNIERANA